MTTWRYFASKNYPCVVRELALPCSDPRPDLDVCPLHDEPLGLITHMCEVCWRTAWDEIGARYAAQPHGARKERSMNHDDEPHDSETIDIIEPEDGALVTIDDPPTNLFLTSDPHTFLVRVKEVADALAAMIKQQKLYVRIRGTDYVRVEGWTALGSLLGVFPVTEWTRRIDDGWEARVVARTRAGELVGAAEAMCTTKESKWRNAEEHAVRSMAATRATSKALRQPLGFVIALAGFDPTPLDEIDSAAPAAEKTSGLPEEVQPTRDQFDRVKALIAQLAEHDPETDWKAKTAELAGVPANLLTRAGADGLIRQLEVTAATLQVPARQP